MKKEELSQALSLVDERFIEEADPSECEKQRENGKEKRSVFSWKKAGAIAASVSILALTASFALFPLLNGGSHGIGSFPGHSPEDHLPGGVPDVPSDKNDAPGECPDPIDDGVVNSLNGLYLNSVTFEKNKEGQQAKFTFHVNHWEKDAMTKVKKLYLSTDSIAITKLVCLGRELPREKINGKSYFVFDSQEENSSFRLDLTFLAEFSDNINSFYQNDLLHFHVLLNDTNEENAMDFYVGSRVEEGNFATWSRSFATVEELSAYTSVMIPTVLPEELQLTNSIMYADSDNYVGWTIEYKTENPLQYATLSSCNRENSYVGYKNEEMYTINGISYRVIYDKTGNEYPNIYILWKASGTYYQFLLYLQQDVNVLQLLESMQIV